MTSGLLSNLKVSPLRLPGAAAPVALAVVVLAMSLPGGGARAADAEECSVCHAAPRLSVGTASGKPASMHVDPRRFELSAHGAMTCSQCHTNMRRGMVPARTAIPAPALQYLKRWRPELQPAGYACIACHKTAFDHYQLSVHAAAQRRGRTETPFCVDCHGSHYVPRAADLESITNPTNVPATCASCHSIGVLMTKFNIPAQTYDSFLQSVHGRKLALGQEDVAVCTSCHGVHAIRSPGDPASPLHPNNIVGTCRKCHPGASQAFALSFRHAVPSRTVQPVVYWIQTTYRWMIVLIVGGMVAYIILDMIRRITDWVRSGRRCP